MYTNWLSYPTPLNGTFRRRQWGNIINRAKVYHEDPSKWEDILIIGSPSTACSQVFERLNQLVFPFNRLKIGYLGDILPNAALSEVQNGVQLLNDAGKTVILLHPDPRYWVGALNSLLPASDAVHAALISRTIPFLPGNDDPQFFLNPFFNYHPEHSVQLRVLGTQEPYVPTKSRSESEYRGFDVVRLGQLQNHLIGAEPLLRDSDWVGFDLSATRHQDFGGSPNPMPSGLTIEQACQLVRYSGMSEKVSGLALFNFFDDRKLETVDAGALALLIWYFVDGFADRCDDFPRSTRHLTEYLVTSPAFPQSLRFWKSERTHRWWFELPYDKHSKSRHRLLPCTYDDYNATSKGELPDRLLHAFTSHPKS